MVIKQQHMKQIYFGFLILLFMGSCDNNIQRTVTKTYFDSGPSYSKAVSVSHGTLRTIYVAGLTGEGPDFESQTRSTFENIRLVLEKAGASFKDIVKTNIYIPNYTEEKMNIFRKVRKEVLGETNMPASTAIGVTVLAAKDKLIEIEAIAVVQIKK